MRYKELDERNRALVWVSEWVSEAIADMNKLSSYFYNSYFVSRALPVLSADGMCGSQGKSKCEKWIPSSKWKFFSISFLFYSDGSAGALRSGE